MTDFTHHFELPIPVRIDWSGGEPDAVIDLPAPVAAWIEDQIGVAGMIAIQEEAEARLEVERADQEALGAECRAEYFAHEAMRMADYGA